MKTRRRCTTLLIAMSIAISTSLFHTPALGQVVDSDAETNEDNGGANQNGDDPNADDPNAEGDQGGAGLPAGVSINALDILRSRTTTSANGDLKAKRRSSARTRRRAAPRVSSEKLRFVSLPRLERAAKKRFDNGQPLTEGMQYLAGLYRADYLLMYPETGDVVIAGPASDWRRTRSGDVLSTNTRQPVLRFEDMVVAMRAFPFGGKGTKEIGCSIDPTRQGLSNMQAYVKSVSGRPPSAPAIAAGLKKALGDQKVTIRGIPAKTNFARVMVEADYRMKLIGIGLESSTIPINSYLSLASPRSSSNRMARWYFVPQYDSIGVSDDQRVMQLGSSGPRLIGEAELVAANGKRTQSARVDRASVGFTTDFTRKYAALASSEPIYAELRNVIDLSLIAAAMQLFDAYTECGWNPELILDPSKIDVETHQVPTELPTAVNAVWKGRKLLTPVGGGVSIRTTEAFESISFEGGLAKTRPELPVGLNDDQWWWDEE